MHIGVSELSRLKQFRMAAAHAICGMTGRFLAHKPHDVHMLGFRGHFATKSRRYSITLGALRRARRRAKAPIAEHRATGTPLDLAALEADLLAEEDTQTTLGIGSWHYAGTGWNTEAQRVLATAAAPYAARVQSLRRLIADLEVEVDVFARLSRGRLAANSGYVALQQLPGVGPVLAAVFLAEVVTCTASAPRPNSRAGRA